MIDVMFYEVFKEEKIVLKRHLPKDLRATFSSKTIQEVHSQNPPAPILCIRTQSRVPLKWLGHLKGVFTRSAGYDHVLDFLRQSKVKIPCGYLVDYCSRAVAEQVILVMLSLLRKFKKQVMQFNKFRRYSLTGEECLGKKMLVVGVGRIGSQIADLAKNIGVDIKGVDIVKRHKGFAYVSLAEGIRWADIIVCALPLTDKTKGMLNYASLKKAKRGCIFINISRGEISPLEDLSRLINEKHLGGLGLDVYPREDVLAECLRSKQKENRLPAQIKLALKLAQKENVIFTPHNAFNTRQSVERKAKESIQAIHFFLKHHRFPNLVPAPQN